MRKIALVLLLFMTGCSSGKWVWELTEAERERERLLTKYEIQRASPSERDQRLYLLEALFRILVALT